MVKNINFNAAPAANLGAYESPETQVLLVQPEGVLCASGLTERFQDADFDWN